MKGLKVCGVYGFKGLGVSGSRGWGSFFGFKGF